MKRPKIGTVNYQATQFVWAVLYRNNISRIYVRGRDAQRKVIKNNLEWKKNGWGNDWSTMRFRYRFKGKEIDSYLHDWERKEK